MTGFTQCVRKISVIQIQVRQQLYLSTYGNRKLVFVLLVFATAPAYAKSASETAKEFYNLLKQNNYSAAAEYYDPAALREFRKLMSFENEIPEGRRKIYFKTFFVPALTDDSISTLSDHDFFVSFWRGILTSERFSGEIKFDDVKILGVVMEGEDLAHVVIRNRISVAEGGVCRGYHLREVWQSVEGKNVG